MNKTKFRLLIFFMILSLIGIILVQLYWVNSSLKNNEEQFKFHIQQVLSKVAFKLEEQEGEEFYRIYRRFKDSTGRVPLRSDLLVYYDRAVKNEDETVIYSDQVTREYDEVFLDKKKIDDLVRKKSRNTNAAVKVKQTKSSADADRWLRFQIEGFLKDFRDYNYLDSWIDSVELRKLIASELRQSGVKTPFEFAIYTNGLSTKVRSVNFTYDTSTYTHPVFEDSEGSTRYRMMVSFPEKR